MGSDDYAATGNYSHHQLPPASRPLTTTGGALKLKGVRDGGIKKKKKKSTKTKSTPPPTSTDVQARPESEQPGEDEDPWAGKTEAERRFEKRKLEQLEKRLAKEGIKSHKERVEEYNKYLASLSEHHDMYAAHPWRKRGLGGARCGILMCGFLGRESDRANAGDYCVCCGGVQTWRLDYRRFLYRAK